MLNEGGGSPSEPCRSDRSRVSTKTSRGGPPLKKRVPVYEIMRLEDTANLEGQPLKTTVGLPTWPGPSRTACEAFAPTSG